MKLEALRNELERARGEIRAATDAGAPVPRAAYERWSATYNDVLRDIADEAACALRPVEPVESDFSFTGRSATPAAIAALLSAVSTLREFVDDAARAAREPNAAFHCAKTDAPCPKRIERGRFRFFIATSFSPEYREITDRLMLKARDELEIPPERIFRADVFLSTRDIMCKICQGMQESDCVVANITGLNPNVMVELGMALGMNKKIVLLKDRRVADREITDLKALEYVEYAADDEWFDSMVCILKGKRII